MKHAIIAAGEGSRLSQEGVSLPKPLVRIHGEAMIDRLIRIFDENGAEEICVMVNHIHPQTEAHVRQLAASRKPGQAPIVIEVKTTPSSMHSFYCLAPHLRGSRFCLTTVDTIFKEKEFSEYIKAFEAAPEADGLMAVTDFIDDEKPLYVATDKELCITGFHDQPEAADRYISGGIYALGPRSLDTLDRCIAEGKSRMRNFQRALVSDGLKLRAYPFGKVLDVDHADDIKKAEDFLDKED